MFRILLAFAFAAFLTGCSTTGQFKIPSDTTLELGGRAVEVPADGVVKTRPFFWSTAGGVPYRLLSKDGKTVKEGKVPARFRVASIFWPPLAIIYWPMGLNGNVKNDLTTTEAAKESPKENSKEAPKGAAKGS